MSTTGSSILRRWRVTLELRPSARQAVSKSSQRDDAAAHGKRQVKNNGHVVAAVQHQADCDGENPGQRARCPEKV
ncbi:hypothetical protein [Verminephrobacter eiseniae]|uniref:hypothetical protein n=1 Tax=Verminephrobacter eiseniae TaxID=364317 RepID=UPI0005A52D1A|nr:hypothetical protein [Verminephrobacter eiseniae]